jgi:bifunctional UDP-N-acetylglucosamine pyrophosphorylase / glucosamine-1-phosphate N-acetyltransferase
VDALGCIILAAGEGKRFKSTRPKPLHAICGSPLIDHVLSSVTTLGCDRAVVIVGAGREQVEAHLAGRGVETAVQDRQLGTGHATSCAREAFADHSGPVLVTYADVPLIRPETLGALIAQHRASGAAATILTAMYDDPTGYGRIVRDADGGVSAIVEHRDADEATRAIHEINSGICVFGAPLLFAELETLAPNNDQGEYYLTDVIGRLVARGLHVGAMVISDREEIMGVNDRRQLAEAEAVLRDRIRRRLMADGVTLVDPAATYIDAAVRIGPDTTVWPGTFILGETTIGRDCEIGGHVLIERARIGDGAEIQHGSVLRDCVLGDSVSIGPFSHLRTGSEVGDQSRIGSYAELVRTTIGRRTKDQHFGYLGDSVVGDDVNIGAGTVTCNYDGANKNRTVIGDGAFIGSNSTIIPPVEIGAGAYVAAGSTITHDVPPDALGIGRSRQETKEGFAHRIRPKRC